MDRTALKLALLLAIGLCGCSSQRSEKTVLLFGAASTSDALDEISRNFERKTGYTVQTSYAATSTLAQQITSGARADVMLSANRQWADYLDDHDQTLRRRDLLANRLVVIVPVDSSVDVSTPDDLLAEEIRHVAMADPEAAPAGMYARQALEKMQLWESLQQKIVTGGDVRQALSFVETGAAEAGIVYATDAAASTSVRVALEIDPGMTEPIRYPLLLLRSGESRPAAEALYEYLQSPEAESVFRQRGFGGVAISD